MKKFILKREMQYTEITEVEAQDWSAASKILWNPETVFKRLNDDWCVDESIEYIGETE